MIMSHNHNAGMQPICNLVSSDIITASVLLWDTAACFLHVHEIGTNVCDPSTRRTPPKVDFAFFLFLQNRRLRIISVYSLLLYSNVTVLFVVGSVMNINDESCYSKIACSVPPCN